MNAPPAEPIDPNDEPEMMKPSATGLLISSDADDEDDVESAAAVAGSGPEAGSIAGEGVAHPTGERQAEENAENDPPA